MRSVLALHSRRVESGTGEMRLGKAGLACQGEVKQGKLRRGKAGMARLGIAW